MSNRPAAGAGDAAAADRPTNRLIHETSPYLLQHARNPVRWFPWGKEAFEEARRRNVPIFLSVGYSTCYWCHVMERESFENEAIGAALSHAFVCVKVDREERPDVDDIYMAAVQLMTRRGGWPMSVWLTPPGARGPDDAGLEPFYAGTYFPAEPRHGMPGLPQLIEGITHAWSSDRAQVLEQAARITEAVRDSLAHAADASPIGESQVAQGVSMLLRMYDERDAGFGKAPKFPQPVFVQFLMDARSAIDDPAVGATVDRAIRNTLDRMALGGMYDQVGGGFHRYSTDERWLVPHFEKMLYDNAQLASLYAEAYRRSADPFDARICRETLDYVLREMTDPKSGAFYSAQDAEVNHREGQNYLWTRAQLLEALGEPDGSLAADIYGVSLGTNFRDPHHPDDPATNVLFLPMRPESLARARGEDAAEFQLKIDALDAKLLAARATRDQPHLDDKVITAWNGLMIAAFAEGARALADEKYLRAAERAAEFILSTLLAREPSPILLRTFRAGTAKTPGFLEDYAMLAHGLLALHRAAAALGHSKTDRSRWLDAAREIMALAEARFADPALPGVYYDTAPGQSDLIVRTRSTHDGALPSAASFMLHNWIDLHDLTRGERDRERALASAAGMSRAIAESPVGAVNSTRALLRLLRLDPAAAAKLNPDGAADDDRVVRMDDAPVEIFAGAERIAVPPMGQGSAALTLELRIKPGFHINSREPGVEGLSPLNIEVTGGTGVSASVKYPTGTPYIGEALPPEDRGTLMVHSGVIRLEITLTRTSEAWSGRPLIHVTYQACDDSACFQPITAELDVAIDPG